MISLSQLAANEEIRQIEAKYFYYTDTKQWDKMPAIFLPDAETDFREAVEPHNPAMLGHNLKIFIANNKYALDGVKTAHFGFNPQIEFLNDNEATAIWGMEDWLWIPEGSAVLPKGTMHGWGHYFDTYRCLDGRWFISKTKLTRIKIDYIA